MEKVMSENAILTVGIVRENLNPVLYRVELANGKFILAHLSKALTVAKTAFLPEARVVLEMTPFDFDQGRILRGEP